jgi:uncharacterized membrane protein
MRADGVVEPLQVVAAALVAAFPWAHGLGVLTPAFESWIAWAAMVGAQALMMLARPARSRLVPVFSLLAVLGLCFVQAVGVYWRLVANHLGRDFALVGMWLAATLRGLFSAPITRTEEGPFSYFLFYFDPVVPLVNVLLRLTDDPARLLGFQLVAVVAAPISVWYLCVREATLKSVQLLLPVALLMHPALVGPLQLDYHTSTIGLAPFLIGSYAFWMNRHGAAFWCLLLGALTKVSYWPSWLVFGMVHGMRRRWMLAGLYGAIGVAALVIYTQLQAQRPQGALGIRTGFGYLGETHAEIAVNAVLKPALWLAPALHPAPWLFFLVLLMPFGFVVFRRPITLAPTVPLALLSLLDGSAWRAIVFNIYAIEYLGFIVAGILVAIRTAGRSAKAIMIVAIALGIVGFLADPYAWIDRAAVSTLGSPVVMRDAPVSASTVALAYDRERAAGYLDLYWRPRLGETSGLVAGHTQMAAFTTCAIGDAPVIATSYSFAALLRGQWDRVYFDEGGAQIRPIVWQSAETLITPGDGDTAGSFASFPTTSGPYDVGRYATLMDRLPIAVATDQSAYQWRYLGGERLAACAAEFGYVATPNQSGSLQLLPGVPY